MLLVKVAACSDSYDALLALAESSGANIVTDHIDSHMIIELTGKAEQLDKFLLALTPYGIIAMTRTGPVGMRRDAKGFSLG